MYLTRNAKIYALHIVLPVAVMKNEVKKVRQSMHGVK
jgi:hypothetical protein